MAVEKQWMIDKVGRSAPGDQGEITVVAKMMVHVCYVS